MTGAPSGLIRRTEVDSRVNGGKVSAQDLITEINKKYGPGVLPFWARKLHENGSIPVFPVGGSLIHHFGPV